MWRVVYVCVVYVSVCSIIMTFPREIFFSCFTKISINARILNTIKNIPKCFAYFFFTLLQLLESSSFPFRRFIRLVYILKGTCNFSYSFFAKSLAIFLFLCKSLKVIIDTSVKKKQITLIYSLITAMNACICICICVCSYVPLNDKMMDDTSDVNTTRHNVWWYISFVFSSARKNSRSFFFCRFVSFFHCL